MDITLTSIFDSNKEALAEKLKDFSLPKDAQAVEKTVVEFLNNMFENDGAYRLGLTQSEDYILQSAIQLLYAQQSIAAEIASMASEFNKAPGNVTEIQKENNQYTPLIGSGIGALAGGLLGTWGAVCGAIAGTAIAVYLATGKKKTRVSETNVTRTINVNAFVNIVKKICESIDNLMETYRVQVKRIQHSYENKEDSSLLSTYSALASQIANVIKVVKASGDEVNPKTITAVQMLENSLENYNLKYENGKIIND